MRRLRIGAALLLTMTACSAQPIVQSQQEAPTPVVADGGDPRTKAVTLSPAQQQALRLVRLDPNAPVRVRVGEAFGIPVSEHPSVGMTWEVTRVTGAVRRDGSFTPPRGPVLPGGDAGPRTFRFVAMRPGEATILMTQSFRGTPEQEMVVRVVVE